MTRINTKGMHVVILIPEMQRLFHKSHCITSQRRCKVEYFKSVTLNLCEITFRSGHVQIHKSLNTSHTVYVHTNEDQLFRKNWPESPSVSDERRKENSFSEFEDKFYISRV